MALPFVLLLASALLIYLACGFFVNGVEWVGQRLGIGETATGTVLAAFGTALPESVVTFVAVVFGHDGSQRDIGVGAAIGGPLALSTLAYATVGLTLLGFRRRVASGPAMLDAGGGGLARDQLWFLAIFVAKIGLGFIAFAGKPWLGGLFLAAYGLYVAKELRSAGHVSDAAELEPLRLRPKASRPSLAWAALQTTLALAVIFGASRIFVAQIAAIGGAFGLEPQLSALLLSPIATEMPETINAFIWARQGKARLALANISGAMMIQATIPSALGLIFTPWLLRPPLVIAGGVTILAITILYALVRTDRMTPGRLASIGILYGVFVFAIRLS